jgi:hypothetical protein
MDRQSKRHVPKPADVDVQARLRTSRPVRLTHFALVCFVVCGKARPPNRCRAAPCGRPCPRSSRGTRAPTRGLPYRSLKPPNHAGCGVRRSISMGRGERRSPSCRKTRWLGPCPNRPRAPPRPTNGPTRSIPAGHGVHRSFLQSASKSPPRLRLRASARVPSLPGGPCVRLFSRFHATDLQPARPRNVPLDPRLPLGMGSIVAFFEPVRILGSKRSPISTRICRLTRTANTYAARR